MTASIAILRPPAPGPYFLGRSAQVWRTALRPRRRLARPAQAA